MTAGDRATCAIVALATMFVLIGSVRSSAAQNLLVNPDFDVDLSGWTHEPDTVFDATRDVAGAAASGSALTTGSIAAASGGSALTGVAQCVSGITPGASYRFGGATSAVGAWVETSDGVVAPAGAQSVVLFQNVASFPLVSGGFEVNYDRMFLEEVGAVPAMGWHGLTELAILLLAVAFLAQRRIRPRRA